MQIMHVDPLVLIYNTLIITNVAKRLFKYVPYRRWGDKTSYLKNPFKCSGLANMAALTL